MGLTSYGWDPPQRPVVWKALSPSCSGASTSSLAPHAHHSVWEGGTQHAHSQRLLWNMHRGLKHSGYFPAVSG